MRNDDDRPVHALIELPPGSDVVGGMPRPSRPITLGRRLSDRSMAYAFVVACAVVACFTIWVWWVGWQLHTTVETQLERTCAVR